MTVIGDAGRLGELARILIDNALKYSPTDQPVTVTVKSEAGRPTLFVRDRGQGLSHEDRHRALDRFYRGAASRGIEGSGLGLAIAHTITVRHGATLRLDAHADGGTVAVVVFRSADASDAPGKRSSR